MVHEHLPEERERIGEISAGTVFAFITGYDKVILEGRVGVCGLAAQEASAFRPRPTVWRDSKEAVVWRSLLRCVPPISMLDQSYNFSHHLSLFPGIWSLFISLLLRKYYFIIFFL